MPTVEVWRICLSGVRLCFLVTCLNPVNGAHYVGPCSTRPGVAQEEEKDTALGARNPFCFGQKNMDQTGVPLLHQNVDAVRERAIFPPFALAEHPCSYTSVGYAGLGNT